MSTQAFKAARDFLLTHRSDYATAYALGHYHKRLGHFTAAKEAYAQFASFDGDARLRKWNLWAYIDARDAAQAVRLSLESPLKGALVFIIANADGVMRRPNDELLDEQMTAAAAVLRDHYPSIGFR